MNLQSNDNNNNISFIRTFLKYFCSNEEKLNQLSINIILAIIKKFLVILK